ncbi:hypothetical protein PT287_07660 [Lactobacillus sp. ESL0679]|uniref:hypothetical protein n=1 Tax=Lactobacillus sp. ESL0679 TaxID=2983209 RepID=UPI0023F6A470|nr:hypothetical protein [Lactobacillus sp. ESL0679]MDF7683376.1 hypothetical protein [Lactobacillus sp. ESL0679]
MEAKSITGQQMTQKLMRQQEAIDQYRGLELWTAFDVFDELVTFGDKDCDYPDGKEFVIKQLEQSRTADEFAQSIDYANAKDMIEDFVENAADDDYWNGIAEQFFDGQNMEDL